MTCFFHKWTWTNEEWIHVVSGTYEWQELYSFYRCEKCRKPKQVKSGIRRCIE